MTVSRTLPPPAVLRPADTPAMTEPVAAAYAAMPFVALRLRRLVYETAATKRLPRPQEALRWGEPTYLPGASGTAIRIGPDRARDGCKLLVHCRTPLVSRWRRRYGARFAYEGTRAILIGAETALDLDTLAACIAEAFTYRKGTDPG